MPLLGKPPIRLDLGATLIGAFVNTALFTFELAAAWYYFHTERGKKDRKVIRSIVMLNLVVDAVGSFAVCANAFTFLVIYLDDTRASGSHWTVELYVLTNSISAFVVQGFMVYRYERLSRNYFVVLPINLLMLFDFGASIWLIVTARGHQRSIERYADLRVVIIVLAEAAFTDICINAALIWKLRMSSTNNMGTRHLVDRIVTYTIVTGCTTSIFALSVLIAYLIYPPSTISAAFAFNLGRVYTLTMIFTLISRDKLSRDPVFHVAIETEWGDSATRANSPPLSTPSTIQGGMQFARPPLHGSPCASSRLRSVSAPPPRISYDLDDASVYESAVSTLTQLSHSSQKEVAAENNSSGV
ncbi:hypothetical protein D9613_003399 [Agrocybe pediades]|uniref:DUF6534 domain-containing protein n=1 Tax=Agrocybe pediades TaxID=84607 RepID=A0A8H4QP20_9AGAR|nr:hypothetical protein D9613_003399 [Agrocybe pediades]